MKLTRIICCLIVVMCTKDTYSQQPLWHNSRFSLFPDSIVQGKFVAKAATDSAIESNYISEASAYMSPDLVFKFSINGDDNEMKPGVDHHFHCLNDSNQTPVIEFGKQFNDTATIPSGKFLAANTFLHIRVNMTAILDAFKKQGYYDTYNGNRIYKADFKGLFVAGATEPMTWDFDNLFRRPALELKDPDGDGIYETSMLLNEIKKERDLAPVWKLSKDISAFPRYQSGHTLANAIYNLSMEEMINAVEPDSTFRTGKEWAGVWTRDISYSIILSMAFLQPRVAMYSLMKKVKNGRIIQDTGTGGAYPVSTDRMIWATAAWELYKVTGDKDWLQQAYSIIRNSVEDDIHNAYDKITGMVKGESSFLDWREQTYPAWMQPADIFESENLGTNAVHFNANRVLTEMAMLLNKPSDAIRYKNMADSIKEGINKFLWMPGKGYYGQFLYGNTHKMISPRSEALGEALCVLFDIAKPAQQKSIIAKTPVTAYGIPCIYPQIPDIPPYHNNAVWPFVQAFWAQASAKAGNENAVLQSMAAIYRPAALFLTNKENFVAANGDYKGTQINSSNMLWSLAGNISLIHKVLFGIQYEHDKLVFAPFVPKALEGNRILQHFRYRDALLNIEMEGSGNQIASFELDGKQQADAFIPADITGTHNLKIKLYSTLTDKGFVNELNTVFSPAAPQLTYDNKKIIIASPVPGMAYRILRNGEDIQHRGTEPVIPETTEYSVYQAIAMNSNGHESFASQPLVILANGAAQVIEAEQFNSPATNPYRGFSGNGFSETSHIKNKTMRFPVMINRDGVYAIDFRYANGNGPVNTDNKCAIRTVKEAGKTAGVVIFPQRGVEEWSNWGMSNPVMLFMEKGMHTIQLSLESFNENMNETVNQAMVDYMRIIQVK